MLNFDEDLKLSITDQKPKFKIKVYPNPTDGQLYLNAPSILRNVEIQIFDITGKKVYQNEFHELQQLMLPESSGFYFLHIKHLGTNYHFKVFKR